MYTLQKCQFFAENISASIVLIKAASVCEGKDHSNKVIYTVHVVSVHSNPATFLQHLRWVLGASGEGWGILYTSTVI